MSTKIIIPLKMPIIMLFIFSILVTPSYQFKDIGSCGRRLKYGKILLVRRVKNYKDELNRDIYDKKKKVKVYNRLINLKKNSLLYNYKNETDVMLYTTIDYTSNDITEELNELISIFTHINKDFISIFNYLIREYIKYNIYESIQKNYKVNVNKKAIIVIIIKNIIVPTIIHDIVQFIFHLLHFK